MCAYAASEKAGRKRVPNVELALAVNGDGDGDGDGDGGIVVTGCWSMRGKNTGECCCAAKRNGAAGGLERSSCSRRAFSAIALLAACALPIAIGVAVGLLKALCTASDALAPALSSGCWQSLLESRFAFAFESRCFEFDELRRRCVRSNARDSDARSCTDEMG